MVHGHDIMEFANLGLRDTNVQGFTASYRRCIENIGNSCVPARFFFGVPHIMVAVNELQPLMFDAFVRKVPGVRLESGAAMGDAFFALNGLDSFKQSANSAQTSLTLKTGEYIDYTVGKPSNKLAEYTKGNVVAAHVQDPTSLFYR
jgi:hypothetical protein